MSRRRIDLSDFSDVLRGIPAKTVKETHEAVLRGFARSIPDLVAASPVDTGLYAASWNFTSDEEKAVIGNTAPYAGVIEYGARPFTPPIAPLLAWAHRVLRGSGAERGQPLTPAEVQETGNSSLSGYSSDEWALAKGVQKKIAERGMVPRHILQNMIPTIIDNIRMELRK